MRTTRAFWDAAAGRYERNFADSFIGQIRREAVWREVDRLFRSGQRILELNCGPGIDAIHMAERGVRVVACDIAPRMIEVAAQRVNRAKVSDTVKLRVLATEDIWKLSDEGRFDGAFSNFAGLNCVQDIAGVARNLANLLNPGAPALFYIIGRFAPWDIVWHLAHGNAEAATRRFRRHSIRQIDGGDLVIQRPSVKQVTDLFAPEFRLKRWKGIGICVPPSYLERWAGRYPKLTKMLDQVDRHIDGLPGFRSMADGTLLQFERTAATGGS